MDDRRVGRLIRAARSARGWRQLDVERASGVDQTTVSLIERGLVGGLTLGCVRRVVSALGMELRLELRGPPTLILRLRDVAHAGLVEELVAILRGSGWVALPEYTFNHFGERGSVDVVAWHPHWSTLLIVEVKTEIVDVQALLATFDRKSRVVPALLGRERGWKPRMVGRLLLVGNRSTARRVVRAHRHTFAAALPDQGRAARRWIGRPVGSLAAVWFLSPTTGGRDSRILTASERRRVRPSRSATSSAVRRSGAGAAQQPVTTTNRRT